jgi:hypothetical protein
LVNSHLVNKQAASEVSGDKQACDEQYQKEDSDFSGSHSYPLVR